MGELNNSNNSTQGYGYRCPKHPEVALTLVLKGGAGWCSRCHCYVQSANHAMPTLPPELIARREQARIEEQRLKRNAKAKAQRAAKSAGLIHLTGGVNLTEGDNLAPRVKLSFGDNLTGRDNLTGVSMSPGDNLSRNDAGEAGRSSAVNAATPAR
jgi:hypothetical protein